MATPNRRPDTDIETGRENSSWLGGLGFNFEKRATNLGAEVLGQGIETARNTANDNISTPGVSREVVRGQSERERGWLKNHTVDRFMTDFETDTERTVLGRDIQAANENIRPALSAANDNLDVLNNEEDLGRGIDRYEDYQNKIRERETRNGNPVDREALQQAFDTEVDRFAPNNDRNRRKMLSRSDILRANWEAYREGKVNLFSLIKGSIVDIAFEYGAIKKLVPVWNTGVGLNENAERVKDSADVYLDVAQMGARRTKRGLRAKREAEIEGTAVMLKIKDWSVGFSQSMKSVVLDVARGKRPPSEIYGSALTKLNQFKLSSPEAFDAYMRKNKSNFLRLQKRETVLGLIMRTTDWYIRPKYRTDDSLTESLAEALPIYGTYASIRDLNDENGLPKWMRYGFVGFNIGLDVLTIGSFGAFTPIAIGLRTMAGFGAKAGAKLAVKSTARQTAKAGLERAGAQIAQLSSKDFLATLPRKVRKTLLSTTSAKMLTGYAAFTGLSSIVDYAFSQYMAEEVLERIAGGAVDQALEQNFTRQQRRLISLTSRTAFDVYRDESQEIANDNIPEGVKAEADDRQPEEEFAA